MKRRILDVKVEARLDALEAAGYGVGDMQKATYDPDTNGIIAIAQGGTNAATAADARTNLGAAATSHTHAIADLTDDGALAALNTVGTSQIDNDAVTYAKIQNVTTDRLLGRDTAGSGDVEELTATGGIEFTGTGIQRSALTGDVTATAGSNSTTIANDAVTYAKMQNVSATDKVLGRSTSGAGDVEEIACTAAGRALIDDAAASDQRTTLGLVAGGAGDIWVEKAGDTMTGPLVLPDGAVGAPALAFSDGGLYRIGTTKFGFATGGALKLTLDGTFNTTEAFKFTMDTNGPVFMVENTNIGNTGCYYWGFHNKAAAIAGDYITGFVAQGNSSTGVTRIFGSLDFSVIDPTNASEDAMLECYLKVAGSDVATYSVANGMKIGAPTGSFKGTGTLNATGVYVNNVDVQAAASATASGIVELATSAETITGTDTVRAVTPAGAAAAYQPLDSDLTALAGNSTNGMWARTGAGTGSARTIAGTAPITVTNGDGVSGAPTIAISAATTSAVGSVYIKPDSVPLHANGAALVWTDMPAAATFFNGSPRHIIKKDLTRFTECRLIVNKPAGTAGVAGAKIHLQYKTTYSTTASDYAAIGSSEVSCLIDSSSTCVVSSWIALAAGAIADVFITAIGTGGDGVVDPTMGSIVAEFR